jgi:hypothetical protein
MAIEVLRSWEGGPLREFSDTRARSHWTNYHGGPKSYAGNYVCENCMAKTSGVYSVRLNSGGTTASFELKWLCGPCKTLLLPKQEQPESLRRKK